MTNIEERITDGANPRGFNGRKLDGRTKAARRWRLIYHNLVSDLGHDPSQFEISLCQMAAGLTILADRLSTDVKTGHGDGQDFLKVTRSLRRTLIELFPSGRKPPTRADDDDPLDRYLDSKGRAKTNGSDHGRVRERL